MINTEKTKLMAEAALYENGSRGDQLKLKKYFEEKPGRLKLKNLIAGAASYLLILYVVLLLTGREIIDFRTAPVTSAIIIASAAAAGALFTFAYARITDRILKKRYRNIRSSFVRYDLLKGKIKRMNQEGKTETVSGE